MGEVALAAGGSGEPRTGLGDVTVVARSCRTAFSASTGRVVSPCRPAARPGAAVGRAVSADGRDHDRVEGLLGAGGVVPVGLGYVAEAAVAAHDGDGRVAQAGQISGQVAHVRPATIFVVGEVAHIVQAVLDVPVVAHEVEQLLGSGALCAERSDAIGHLDAALAGLEDLALSLDAHRLAPPVEVGVAVPLGSGEGRRRRSAGARCGHGPCRRFRARPHR